MSTGGLLGAMAGAATARPRLVVAVAGALALAGAVLAFGLSPSGATDTFVGRSSEPYRATEIFYRQFGEEPIEVLVQGNLQQLVESSDLERLLGLEGCLSGRVPPAGLVREGGRDGPCGRLAAAGVVKVVLGPGTFVNEAATEIDQQLARSRRRSETQASAASATVVAQALARGLTESEAQLLGKQAREATLKAYAAEIAAVAVQYGLGSEPAVNNPEFVNALVFSRTARAGTPKGRFAYLFPSANAALVSVRLRSGLSEAQRSRTIALIRAAVAMPQWRLQHGERYLVTGEPVIVSDLTGSLAHSIELLLAVVVAVMAVALSLLRPARPSLLPLGMALLTSAVAFGALALWGGSLTLGSLAVLPVLVGLAVDYAIQLQSRTEEYLAQPDFDPPALGPSVPGRPAAGHADMARQGREVAGAVRSAAVVGGPAVGVAALASAAGILGLLVSPVPLVRGFAELLVAGIAIGFLCALVVGSAALVLWHGRPAGARPGARVPRAARGAGGRVAMKAALACRILLADAGGRLAASWRGASELVRENRLPSLVRSYAVAVAFRRPRTVLGLGLLLAVAGWGLSTQTHVQTQITKLVPQDLPSLQNLDVLERETGSGGQIDLLLSGAHLTSPAVVRWMISYQTSVLHRFGYGAATAGAASESCTTATLCPAFSLSDLFSGGVTGEGSAGAARATPGARALTAGEIDGLLAAIPQYFSQSVVTRDRRYATLAFGIRLMALDRQQRVIEAMRSMLHPPRGVRAQLVGLAVLAAQADASVASAGGRLLALLVSVLAVTAVLLVAFRGDPRRTLSAAIPVILASGWSGLLVFATRITLNPMSVTLGCLVVAIATECSVLLSERYRQQRAAGYDPGPALGITYRRTGAAVAASAVTAIAGFGVLAVSDVRMLADFGLVTVLDLAVALVGVLLLAPSVLVLTERLGAPPPPPPSGEGQRADVQ